LSGRWALPFLVCSVQQVFICRRTKWTF